jgi:hypothetical protein
MRGVNNFFERAPTLKTHLDNGFDDKLIGEVGPTLCRGTMISRLTTLRELL